MSLNRADAVRKMAEAIYKSGDDAARQTVREMYRRAATGDPGERWARDGARHLAGAVGLETRMALEGGSPFLLETIVFGVMAPVFVVRDNAVVFDDSRPDPMGWGGKIGAASHLSAILPAVGRVEAAVYPPDTIGIGTAWVVEPGVVITNRHVAKRFAEQGASGFRFSNAFGSERPMSARIDFREEFGSALVEEIPVAEVLYIAADSQPDIALLRLEDRPGKVARNPLRLASASYANDVDVAVIGYPEPDPRVSTDLVREIFGDIFAKKRFAPGRSRGIGPSTVRHLCSTLGGNSGSPVIDLGSGEVVGIHYGGVPLTENLAEPVSAIRDALAGARRPHEIRGSGAPEAGARLPGEGISMSDGRIRFTIPIEVTLSVGALRAVADVAPAIPAGPPIGLAEPDAVESAVAQARGLLASRPDVVAVRAGWEWENGWITDRRAVVVYVRQKFEEGVLGARGTTSLPPTIGGVPVDIAVAPLLDTDSRALSLAALEGPLPVGKYVPRPDLDHGVREETMQVVAHAGPDAGWPQLSGFLLRTRRSLSVAMFELTAPHVIAALKDALRGRSERLDLILQRGENIGSGTKEKDLTDAAAVEELREALGDRFDHVWASVGPANGIFPYSYHIKVAVRDRAEIWLSSGSWQSSNQPAHDPIGAGDTRPPLLNAYNREWHVLLRNKGLAALFEEHIRRDIADARAVREAAEPPAMMVWVPEAYFYATAEEASRAPRYFPPLALDRKVKVQPVLTPDNYADAVLPLIQSATTSLYFQNQYISIKQSRADDFTRLLDALKDKQKAGLDVRILLRDLPGVRESIEAMKDWGFDVSQDRVRVQRNAHTKGIIVDGSAALVGSHNWSSPGTTYNRDASLLFFDAEIARYYQQLFLYDWDRVGRSRIDESLPAPVLATGNEAVAPAGMVLMRLDELLGR